MVGRNQPNTTYDKKREIANTAPDSDLYQGIEDQPFADFVSKVQNRGKSIYKDLGRSNKDGLSDILESEDEVSESTQVMLDLSGVLAKSKYLIDVINDSQSKTRLFIPVNGNNDVKRAISRIFNGSSPGHDKVYWEMWVAVVRHKVRQSELIGSEFLESLTGNESQDAKILDDTIKAFELSITKEIASSPSSANNASNIDRGKVFRQIQVSPNADILKELLVYGAALIGLYFLNRKLAVFKAPESQQIGVTSTIYPSPASIPIMIVQIIIGLAAHFLIEGLLDDDIQNVLVGMDIPGIDDDQKQGIIEQAMDLANGNAPTSGPLKGKDLNHPEVKALMGFKDGFLDIAKSYYLRGDYELIYTYCSEWLGSVGSAIHTKDDFSQWIVLPELESMSYSMENSLDEAPAYSKEYNDNMVQSKARRQTTKPISNDVDLEYKTFRESMASPSKNKSGFKLPGRSALDRATDGIKEILNPNEMIGSLLSNLQRQNCDYNSSLDKLAGFITNDPYITSSLCCFVRYFGAVDVKLLSAIRTVVQIFANGIVFDLGGFLNSITSNIYDDILNKARARLASSLNAVFSEVIDETIDWMDSETLEILQECLPIDGLLKFTAAAMEDLEASLTALISDFLSHLQVQVYSLDSKISILSEQRWAKTLYTMLDLIIDLADQANDCVLTGNPFLDENTRSIIDQLLSDPGRQPSISAYESSTSVVRGLDDVANDTTRSIETKDGTVEGRRITPRDPVVLTNTVRYSPGIVSDKLNRLLRIPSEFNTFSDIDRFYTENGLPIDSIVKNLDNQESFKTTSKASITEEQLETCFQSIDQSEILKSVLRKRNEQKRS